MPRKNMDGSRGCFMPAVACIVLFLLLCLGRAWSAEQNLPERLLPDKVSLDFVDASLQDVARSVSLAYGVPVLVDADAKARVTFHLDGVGLLEGLTSLCSTLGLELGRDGTVFHIRKERARGENYFDVRDSLVSIDVRERDVREFIRDFSANTGLNVVASPEVAGRRCVFCLNRMASVCVAMRNASGWSVRANWLRVQAVARLAPMRKFPISSRTIPSTRWNWTARRWIRSSRNARGWRT